MFLNKRFVAGLVCLAALMFSACSKPAGSYEVEVISPQRTSAPAPNSNSSATATPTPKPQAGYLVGPFQEFEIVGSLADYSAPTQTQLENRDQLAFFKQDGKTGVIDLNGTIVIPAEKDVHWCPVCGITNADESEIYDAKGQVVGSGGHGLADTEVVFDPNRKGLYVADMGVFQPWTDGVVNTLEPVVAQVATLTDTTKDNSQWKGYSFLEEDHPVLLGETQGYTLFNPDGTLLSKQVFQAVERASTGLFAVQQQDVWGYLNQATGEMLVEPVYLAARPFWGDRAAVKTETGWGYISLAGSEKTTMTFLDAATASSDGKAWVKTQDGWGVILLADYKPG